MSNPFAGLGIDLAAIVATTLAPIASIAATLTKITAGVYDINNPAGGLQNTTADFACRVVMTEYITSMIESDLVRKDIGKVTVLLGTVASGKKPIPGDKITLETPTGLVRTFYITGQVDVDACGATATCEVEGT